MIPNIYTYDDIVRVLKALHRYGFKSALIAGGAVRDLYFEILPTDIDIYVWDPAHSKEVIPGLKSTDWNDFWTKVFNLNVKGSPGRSPYIRDRIEFHRDNSAYASGTAITGVWDMMKNMIPFQIIMTKVKPEVYVNEYFDIGLCKAYCDGTKFRYTPCFMRDMRHKTLTIVGQHMTLGQMKHTVHNHLPRMTHKFPGYQLRVEPWNFRMYSEAVGNNRKP